MDESCRESEVIRDAQLVAPVKTKQGVLLARVEEFGREVRFYDNTDREVKAVEWLPTSGNPVASHPQSHVPKILSLLTAKGGLIVFGTDWTHNVCVRKLDLDSLEFEGQPFVLPRRTIRECYPIDSSTLILQSKKHTTDPCPVAKLRYLLYMVKLDAGNPILYNVPLAPQWSQATVTTGKDRPLLFYTMPYDGKLRLYWKIASSPSKFPLKHSIVLEYINTEQERIIMLSSWENKIVILSQEGAKSIRREGKAELKVAVYSHTGRLEDAPVLERFVHTDFRCPLDAYEVQDPGVLLLYDRKVTAWLDLVPEKRKDLGDISRTSPRTPMKRFDGYIEESKMRGVWGAVVPENEGTSFSVARWVRTPDSHMVVRLYSSSSTLVGSIDSGVQAGHKHVPHLYALGKHAFVCGAIWNPVKYVYLDSQAPV